MSCYISHLKKILSEVGVEVTRENRRKIDQAVRRMVGAEDQTCPVAWRAVREAIARDREGFVSALREEARRAGW